IARCGHGGSDRSRGLAAADKFFPKEVATQKQATPLPPPGPSSLPEIVSDQISGDGARLDEFSLFARPPGGLRPPPPVRFGGRHSHPMKCRAGPPICLRPGGDACVLGVVER